MCEPTPPEALAAYQAALRKIALDANHRQGGEADPAVDAEIDDLLRRIKAESGA